MSKIPTEHEPHIRAAIDLIHRASAGGLATVIDDVTKLCGDYYTTSSVMFAAYDEIALHALANTVQRRRIRAHRSWNAAARQGAAQALPTASSGASSRNTEALNGRAVSRRAEYLSKSDIDRGWPHQVAKRDDDCTGHNYRAIHYFIASEKLSHCWRGHFFYRDGVGFHVFCFAEREHAESFRQRFGGEFIDPKDRPRWPGSRNRSR